MVLTFTATFIYCHALKHTIINAFISCTAAPWYAMPYMFFVYGLVAWGICAVLIIILFFYKKKRAEHDLPPEDPWLGN